MQIVWNLSDWADAVQALPVDATCPERTIIIPNHRVAHALRRALLERGHHHALTGTRFITLLHLAQELTSDNSHSPAPNDRDLPRTPGLVPSALR